MLLSVKDVTIHYGKAIALRDVSLEIFEGTIVAVIGSNGAGKSTLLHTISGLKNPSTGEIRFNDSRIDNIPPDKRVNLGIAQVPEGRRLFPYMTVTENLEMGAYCQKDKRRVRDTLEDVWQHFPVLKERGSQLAGTLSGGEQQMLAFGRALMAKPKLLLLDEPSLGMSPLMVREIGNIIQSIHQAGVSVLLVEQNASLALRVAQNGCVLETGTVVLKGETKELLKNEFVKKAYLGM